MTLSFAQKEIKKLFESNKNYKIEQKQTIYKFRSDTYNRYGYMNDDVRRHDALVGFSFNGVALVRKDDEQKKNEIRQFFNKFSLGNNRKPVEGKDWKWQLKPPGKRESESYPLIINSELVKKVYKLCP